MAVAAANLDGFEAWGAEVDGRLAATLMFTRVEDCVDLLYQQSLREANLYDTEGLLWTARDWLDKSLASKRPPPGMKRFWERLRLVQWSYQRGWERKRNRYDLNEALLDRYLKDSGTIGFRPVVAFFPGRGDTDEDQERRGFLKQWTTRHDVPYLDLTAAIHDAGVDNVYLVDNWHWNPSGHRLAAQQLRSVLHRLLDKPAQD
jgi:hypothetical protein